MNTMTPQKPSQRARTKAGTIQKAPGNGVTKQDITAAKISESMTKRSPEVVKKLEEAFAIDASVGEACLYAGISEKTYYNWVNADEELLQRFKELRQTPVLKARTEVVKGLKDDKHFSLAYLKAKKPDEFGEKQKGDIYIEKGVVVLPARNNAIVPAEVLTIENPSEHGGDE